MSFTDFFAGLRRQDKNAAVIFDRSEPIGQPTDLVMPRRRFLDRVRRKKDSAAVAAGSARNES
jgi:hypothetical protein